MQIIEACELGSDYKTSGLGISKHKVDHLFYLLTECCVCSARAGIPDLLSSQCLHVQCYWSGCCHGPKNTHIPLSNSSQ